ncbi:AAA family ATPase [Streptomyces winkii]|uniref:AAA family ATPase n=1 Tax=Streptomyces winkii TaxID=3051178 RepID=UPI0028D3C417|nr:AAA family ATPase [Streptomyces sp. DSM 40971]
MPRCSQAALEQSLRQLAEHAGDNKHRSNWMSTFLAACYVEAAGYPNTISGVNRAVEDLFVLLPDDQTHGRINPFIRPGAAGRWLKINDSGRSTVWNTGTRSGTQTVLFDQNHFKYGLRDDAIDILLEGIGDAQLPGRDALAVFLTRRLDDWAGEPTRTKLHEAASQEIGLSADEFARITSDRELGCPILGNPEWSPELIEKSTLGPPSHSRPADEPEHHQLQPPQEPEPVLETEQQLADDVRETEGLTWTRDVCHYPLSDVNVDALTRQVLDSLEQVYMVLPDAERLVRRCVNALLVGNLVLQGPPGTGKTTLARLLAEAFEVALFQTTATSEWSPYHVVGGFRPSADGGLTAAHGTVTQAALHCAHTVRQDVQGEGEAGEESLSGYQATWLFIDEFNRADIDKAIGPLFTILSSCDANHLRATPVDLWFESDPTRRQLWIPARFRIIAAMNDLDTSFVNQISQGLTRRFQFVTVGVPTERASADLAVTTELRHALASAHRWLHETYGHTQTLHIDSLNKASLECEDGLKKLQRTVDGLRQPDSGPGWPVGTAQVVDVLKLVLLQWASNPAGDIMTVIDEAVADRFVPQMADLGDELHTFAALFQAENLTIASQALRHLADPHHIA